MLKMCMGHKMCFILLHYFCAKNLLLRYVFSELRSKCLPKKYEGLQLRYLFLGAFAQSLKGPINFVMSARLPAYISSAPPGRIFVKFDIGVFYDNL
jgi:hypothetical protein